MSLRISMHSAGWGRWRQAPAPRRICALTALLLLVASMQACSYPQLTPVDAAEPANSGARVPDVSYVSVTNGYVSARPVDPLPWREQNERVAPGPKQ